MKKGESFETALFRELQEEVALSNVSIECILGIYHSRREAKDDHIVIFAVRVADDLTQDLRRTDLMEIEDVRWFPIDATPDTVSPATSRRIAVYRSGAVGFGTW
ncbi:NUDIX domain-containing protein [Novosphingobium organovorum]|uniref:NUDIX domain-containing protein n=1 Tax=Novosphingobium organovorum TaxID=2930092 RepID=UPI001FB93102|nr:NUDIX domain-containing protein [Novosphingobium organovorum]